MEVKKNAKRAYRIRRIREIIGAVLLCSAFVLLFLTVLALDCGRIDFMNSMKLYVAALVLCGLSVPIFGI